MRDVGILVLGSYDMERTYVIGANSQTRLEEETTVLIQGRGRETVT